MDLRGIVSNAIAMVNPLVPLTLRVSTGYATDAAGNRVSSYADPVTVICQVQPLSNSDIQQMDGLQIQGNRQRVYVKGSVDGIVRYRGKGGDLLTFPDGSVWKVCVSFEDFPDWCAVGVVLQGVT